MNDMKMVLYFCSWSLKATYYIGERRKSVYDFDSFLFKAMI